MDECDHGELPRREVNTIKAFCFPQKSNAVYYSADGELWQTVQKVLDLTTPHWHSSKITSIKRLDNGVDYSTTGEYEISTHTFTIKVTVF